MISHSKPRYPKVPDIAKCSEADRTEAANILDNATKESLLSGDVVDANATTNATTNATNVNREETDIGPSSSANVAALVEKAKLDFCEAEESCKVESLESDTESESLGRKMILLVAANTGSWDWRLEIFLNLVMKYHGSGGYKSF